MHYGSGWYCFRDCCCAKCGDHLINNGTQVCNHACSVWRHPGESTCAEPAQCGSVAVWQCGTHFLNSTLPYFHISGSAAVWQCGSEHTLPHFHTSTLHMLTPHTCTRNCLCVQPPLVSDLTDLDVCRIKPNKDKTMDTGGKVWAISQRLHKVLSNWYLFWRLGEFEDNLNCPLIPCWGGSYDS